MRITIDLPDELFRRLKAEAASRKTSIQKLVVQVLEVELTKRQFYVRLPLIRSKRPGTLDLTNAEIDELLL